MLENIKSKLILNRVLENLKNKKKLNMVRYSNKYKQKLNLTKKDFEQYILLKEFNDKFNAKVDDINYMELNIRGKYIGDEGSIYLFIIRFKNVLKLDISYNDISYINVLKKYLLMN